MRLTLVVLSNLRALLVTRAVLIAFLLAILCASAATRAHAAPRRVHHKAAATSAHRHPAPVRTRSTRTASSHPRTYTAAHRRVARHRATVVRARMPVRRYSWMAKGSAASTRATHQPATEATDAAGENTETAQRTSRPAPETSVAAGEISDPADTNTSSPQDAANQIAAAEIPGGPHAELHAAGPDPFLNKNIVKMAPLRGSLESLIRQNEKTNADNLERIEDDADLQARIANGQLVHVPESAALAVNPSLPEDRRYCRPWTATFLKDLSKAHESQFHRGFEVSSAVRTVAYQKHLMRTNGNAAPAEGDVASPHLTGATIDIAKRGLTRSELYWMRNRLQALQDQGKIDVEEEFRQSCFHITVYKSYVGAGPARKPNPHTLQTPDEDDETPAAPADQPVHPA